MLVAAALAPPAGVAGMAAAIARWELVATAASVVGAQLVGINLVAAVVFPLYGLSPSRPRLTVGRRGVFPVTAAASLVDADVRFSPYRTDPDRFVATLHVEPIAGTDEEQAIEHVETIAGEVLARLGPEARPLVEVVTLSDP